MGRFRAFGVGFVAFFALVASAHGVSRADCGTHQLKTVVQRLRAVENMPVSAQYGARNNALRNDTQTYYVRGCPEDPWGKQAADENIARVWLKALQEQDELAFVDAFYNGKVQSPDSHTPPRPHVCAMYFITALQAEIARDWQIVGADYNPSFASSPYFKHIADVYRQTAYRTGRMPLPSLNADMTRWRIAYFDRASSYKAHLPDGVECGAIPSQ